MVDLREYSDRRGLILATAIDDPGHRSALRTELRRGRLTRLAPGAYVQTALWDALDTDARYRAIVHACASGRLADDELLCGPSAAALWRLPTLRRWPESVHAMRPYRGGGRKSGRMVRHACAQRDPGCEIDDLPVTTLARTVSDIAATCSRAEAVAVADAALRGSEAKAWFREPSPREQLLENARERPVSRGRSRAERVILFADARAGSAGESLLRVTLDRLGLPPAELQVPFIGDSGRKYFADFYWPDQDFVLEFDGKVKYTDPRLRAGRTAEEIVYEEKLREDEIRAQVRGMTRVDWVVAGSTELLAHRLMVAGFIFPSGPGREGALRRHVSTGIREGLVE